MSRFLLLNFEDFGLNQDITQTIQSHTLFCICCLKTNVPLINLSSCCHASYLDRFTKPKLKPFNRVACNDCHLVLKKIHEFNSKVEENFQLLASEYFDITKINKNPTSNLQTKKAVDVLLSPVHSQEKEPSTILNEDIMQEENKKLKNIKAALNILGNVQSSNMGVNHNSTLSGQILKTVMNVLGTVTNLPKRSSDETSKTEVEIKREMIEIEVPPADQSVEDTSCNPWSSKIKTIKLTKEELMRERSLEAQSQAYLKHPYKCESCIIGFFYEENLQDHIARKHSTDASSTIVTCEICLQVLPPAGTNLHAFRHYTRYDCRECNKRFGNFNEAWLHASEHKANGEQTNKYQCRFCNYTTDFFTKLKMHKQRHGKFPCKECGVIFMRTASREKHMSIVHNKTSLHCEKCNTSFEHEIAFKKHMHVHAYCAPCNLRFSTWNAYRMHVRLSNVHSANLKLYRCKECGMKFRTITQRRTHTASRHPKSHIISCKHCRKTFASEKECKSHMEFHVGYDVIYCDHCRRAYKSRLHLIRHLETHSKKVKAKGNQPINSDAVNNI